MPSRKDYVFTGFDFVIEAFSFLVRDYGFTGPRCEAVGVEFHHTYIRGNLKVDVWHDSGGPYVDIFHGAWMYSLINLDPGKEIDAYELRYKNPDIAVARFIEDHPELLCRDSDYLDALEDEWYVKNNLRPWRRGLRAGRHYGA